MWVFSGVASERDFPMDDWQYVAGEGYVVSGNPSWPDGMVCRACYPQVAREWGELLAGWTPPVSAGIEKSPLT